MELLPKNHLTPIISDEIRELNRIINSILPKLTDKPCVKTCKSWRYPTENCIDVNDLNDFNFTKDYQFGLELIIDRIHFALNIFVIQLESSKKRNIQRPEALSVSSLLIVLWNQLEKVMDVKKVEKNDHGDAKVSLAFTQTEERSLGYCESCSMACDLTKKLIYEIEDCMKAVSLDSDITKSRVKMKQLIFEMTQWGAMKEWTTAINSDTKNLIRLSKQSVALQAAANETLEKKLAELHKLQGQYELLKSIKRKDESKQEVTLKLKNDLEHKNQMLIGVNKELENRLSSIEAKQLKVQTAMEKTIHDLTNELNNLRADIRKVESTKSEEALKYQSEVHELEEERVSSAKEILKLQNKLMDLKLEGSKGLQQLKEMLDAKEKENEILKHEIETVKESNQQLDFQRKQLVEDLKVEKDLVKGLRTEVENLRDQITLLVMEPGMKESQPKTKISGNPLADMKEQLAANEKQIQILMQKNIPLQKTIEKLSHLTTKPPAL